MAKGDDIEKRLILFAVRIIKLCNSLPNTPVGRHFSGQLVRSGTSPAFNYGEARSAESRRDFVHKMRIVHKELNESRINLEIIELSELLAPQKLGDIRDECDQLCRIIGKSISTALEKR